MGIFSVIRNILALCFIIAIVYGITVYSGGAKDQLFSLIPFSQQNVQGASTQRATELSNQLQSDLGEQATVVKDQAMQVNLGDMITGVARLQQIPQDIHMVKEYTVEQVTNFFKRN